MSDNTNDDTATTTAEEEVVQVLPFTETDMDKQEMLDHLLHFHNAYPYNSKETKAELVRRHQFLHDSMTKEPTRDRWGRETKPHVPTIKHVHTPVSVKAITGEEELAQALDKPLTNSQKKALKDLVDNDFATLRKEMEVFAHDLMEQRMAEVKESFANVDAKREAFADEGRALIREALDELNTLKEKHDRKVAALRSRVEKAKMKIIMPDSTNVFRGSQMVAVEVTGMAEELAKVKQETDREIQGAKLAMERERLRAQRQIMLAGVPKESLALIQQVPTAQSLMQKAAGEREQQREQIESSMKH